MSDAKKCDRCGEYYVLNNKSRVILEYYASSDIGRTRNGGDVCPICVAKFEKWWCKKRSQKGCDAE